LEFKPGSKHAYSNSGYFLLGVIIEKASGESYDHFLRQHIFAPLQMNDSGVYHNDADPAKRAVGYEFKEGKLAVAAYFDISQLGGAGALSSTVEDLFRWNEALYGGRLLQPTSQAAMLTKQSGDDDGYGLWIDTELHRQYYGHLGGISGFKNAMWRFVDDRVTVVVLRNLSDGAPPPPTNVGHDLAAILFGEKYEVPRAHAEVKVAAKTLDAYVGRYELEPNVFLTIARRKTGLTVQKTGQQVIDLFAESETQFFLKLIEAQIRFVKDDKGQVTGLIFKRGEEQWARKVK